MPPTADLSPTAIAAVETLADDCSLAFELGTARVLLRRQLAAILDGDDDPRLARDALTAINTIVRVVQAQSRLADPDADFTAEVDRARAERGLLPGVEPAPIPTPATAIDAVPDPDDPDDPGHPNTAGDPGDRDEGPGDYPLPHLPAPWSAITPPTPRSRSAVARPTRAPPR